MSTLNAPCNACPFLREQVRMLRPARKREIADSLRRGTWFPCHKTVDYSDDDGGHTTSKSRFCAGALATMENEPDPGAHANQAVRIAQRLGVIDLRALQGKDRVFASLREFCAGKDAPKRRPKSTGEPCSVVDDDCTAPAGYQTGAGVVEGDAFAEFTCHECGEPVCGECSAVVKRRRVCNGCAERK